MSSPDGQQNEPMGARAMMQAFNIGQEPAAAEESRPTMRSLQIHSSGAGTDGPGLIGAGPMGGPGLIRGPPPGLGKPPRLGFEKPAKLTRGLSKGSVGVKQEWDGVVASTSWDVKCEDLEKVPEDFPLERTHRLIQGVEAPVVAARISETLKVHSIQAEYNSKPPKAKCKTRDFVSFRIRLYAGSESGDPVVVEVQRRKGPASCFMHACRAILAAAEGKTEESANSTREMPPFAKKPLSEMKCLQGAFEETNEENEKQTAQSALKDAKSMLRSEKRDTCVLGLENLASLTDPIKTNPAVSLHVAKGVALGLGNEDVREEIIEMTERDVFASDAAAADDMALANHTELLRQLAITIFANSLSLCARDGCLSNAPTDWFEDYLIPNLLDEVKRAETNSCNATQAAVCVHSLAISSESTKRFLVEHGACEVLRKANKYGVDCNELLANETERCLKVLS